MEWTESQICEQERGTTSKIGWQQDYRTHSVEVGVRNAKRQPMTRSWSSILLLVLTWANSHERMAAETTSIPLAWLSLPECTCSGWTYIHCSIVKKVYFKISVVQQVRIASQALVARHAMLCEHNYYNEWMAHSTISYYRPSDPSSQYEGARMFSVLSVLAPWFCWHQIHCIHNYAEPATSYWWKKKLYDLSLIERENFLLHLLASNRENACDSFQPLNSQSQQQRHLLIG